MRNNAGYALIVTIIMITVFSMIGLTGMLMVSTEKHMELDTLHAAQAFYLTESGIQYMAYQLKNDSDWSKNKDLSDQTALGGTFDVEYLSQSKDKADLQITGKTGSAKRKINIKFVRSAPPVYEDALTLGGKKSVSGKKTKLTIEGSVLEKASKYATPDYAYLKGMADKVISSNMTFKKNKKYTGVFYVKGNVTIQKNVTINGTVIAEGNVSISGKGKIHIQAAATLPALVTKGNIAIGGKAHLKLNGIAYADGNVGITDKSKVLINGALAAKGNLECKGSSKTSIRYDPAFAGPQGFKGGGSGTGVVSYQDWQEPG